MKIHWHAVEEMVDIRDNLLGKDPLFVDPASMNFQIRSESPAYKLGFQRISIEEIGLQRDEYRTRLPSEP